ncbi:MAG: hypothetical protein IPN95_25210 [Bacteroidetes bacterium]|nr:hypothetical protein [Bacteroidota bacterium]
MDQPTLIVPVDTVHWILAGSSCLLERPPFVLCSPVLKQFGYIDASALLGGRRRTPLQTAIANLVVMLLYCVRSCTLRLPGCVYVGGFGIVDAMQVQLRWQSLRYLKNFSRFTFFLGVGVYRLAQRRRLVRRAVVVENIGRYPALFG